MNPICPFCETEIKESEEKLDKVSKKGVAFTCHLNCWFISFINKYDYDTMMKNRKKIKETKEVVNKLIEIKREIQNIRNVTHIESLEKDAYELIKKLPDELIANYVLFGIELFDHKALPEIRRN